MIQINKIAEHLNLLKEGKVSLDELLYPGKQLASIPVPNLKVDVLPTGFPSIDKYLFLKDKRSELIVVGGRPSHGKSAWLFQLALNVSQSIPVHVFSLEMDHEQILTRQLAIRLNKSITDIQSGNVDYVDLENARLDLEDLKYIIDDRAGLDVYELCDAARHRHKIDNTQLIIIDYLQLLKTEKSYSKNDEIGEITKALKSLAKELKVPVIVASQLSRMNEVRGREYGDYTPILSDLRDSGNIEQDADIVAFVHRESKYKNTRIDEADIVIAKNRNGACGTVKMKYIANQTKFVDIIK